MFSRKLVNFLETSFPAQLSEISTAMDLLIESLDEAYEAITAGSNKLLAKKEHERAINFIENAKELHSVSGRMQDFTEILQLDDVASISEDEVLEDIEKAYPDYSEYKVDNSVAHTLHENYVHTRPYAFKLRGQKVYVTKWKDMLVKTCEILAGIDAEIIAWFPNIPRFNDRKSRYFQTDKPVLMRSPQKLQNMDMYVETNFSANFIRNLIIKMINHYKIPLSEFKIYLRADYTGLHRGADDNSDTDEGPTHGAEDNSEGQQGLSTLEITGDCVKRVSDHLQKPLSRHSKAIYRTYDHKTTVVCLTSSERDKGAYLDYWFGLRVNQKNALESAEKAYVALGCGSKNKIILVPYRVFSKWLDDMSTSVKEGHIRHWHITVVEKGSNFLLRLKAGRQDKDLIGYILKH